MAILRWFLLVIGLALLLVANMPRIVEDPATLATNPLYAWSARAREARMLQHLQRVSPEDTDWRLLEQDGKALLRRAPTSGSALALISYSDSELGGDLDHSRLTRMAVSRDPRFVFSIYADMERRVRDEDYEGIVAGLNTLIRVQPEIADSIGTVIARLLTSPEARDALLRVPAASRWRGPLLRTLVRSKEPADVAYATDFLRGVDEARFTDLKVMAVMRALQGGDVEQAQSLWGDYFAEGRTNIDAVRDPAFERQSPPPFGWNLLQEAEGRAEISPHGGIDVLYRSRLSKPLLQQFLTLEEGRYRLLYEGTAPQRGLGTFVVQLLCNDDEVPLATIPIVRGMDKGRIRRRSESFAIPAGSCPVQTFALIARNGTRSLTQDLHVDRLDIMPAGGAE